jgi:1-deoxy-D-xylulose 5-phosphate reductoisomerase
VVAEAMEQVPQLADPSLDDILEADAQARRYAQTSLTYS